MLLSVANVMLYSSAELREDPGNAGPVRQQDKQGASLEGLLEGLCFFVIVMLPREQHGNETMSWGTGF